MSPVKEAGYFCWAAEKDQTSDWPRSRLDRFYPVRSFAAYEALFAETRGRRAIGEATPHYLAAPGVPEAMAACIPDARLIAILREPTARAFANWVGRYAEGREQSSFDRAVEEELARLDEPVGPGEIGYVRIGFYLRHLQRFLRHFPRERLLVLLFDDLIASPDETMREVAQFIGVDDAFRIDTSFRHNSTGMPRSVAIERLLSKTRLTEAVRRTLPPAVRDPLFGLAMRLRARNRIRVEIPPPIRERLLDVYREDTLALGRWLARDLSGWLDPRRGRPSPTPSR
jgi:hypothetical protein